MSELKNKEEYIRSVFHKDHDLKDQILYALSSCLSPSELSKLYIDNLGSAQFRNLLKKHILINIDEHGYDVFISFISELFSLLEPYETQRTVWINVILYPIIEYFPKEYIEKYFSILIKSHREYDHIRAYKLAPKIWNDNIEDQLWNDWERIKYEQCINTLIENSNQEKLKAEFKSIWNNQEITSITKRKLLFKIVKDDFSYAEILKDTDPITYLYCVVITDHHLSPANAYELTLKSKNQDELGIAIWCLGQLGYWDTIKNVSEELPGLLNNLESPENGAFPNRLDRLKEY